MIFGKKERARRRSMTPSRQAASSAPEGASEPGLPQDPSAEELMLRDLTDRVVVGLLFEELVTAEQVEHAWVIWQKQPESIRIPLWRVLAARPEVDEEAVRAVAARAYGFEEAAVQPFQTLAFIERHADVFTDRQWRRLIELCLLPIAKQLPLHAGENRWVFATHEPTRPEVHRFLEALKIGPYEVCYAPERMLVEVFTSLFLGQDEAHDEPTRTVEASDPADGAIEEPGALRVTFMDTFEGLLEKAANRDDGPLHIGVDEQGWVTVAYGPDPDRPAYTEANLSFTRFATFIRDSILRAEASPKKPVTGSIQRWIGDALVQVTIHADPLPSEGQPAVSAIRFRARAIESE